MKARFYIKFESKVNQVCEMVLPDNMTQFMLQGTIIPMPDESFAGMLAPRPPIQQNLLFYRITREGLSEIDGAIFLFDADKFLKKP